MLNKLLSNLGIFCFLSLSGVTVLWSDLDRLEGAVYPVVGNGILTDIEEKEEGVLIWVSFTKERDCDFNRIAWFWQNNPFPVVFLPDQEGRPTSRLEGVHSTGPWLVKGLTHNMLLESIAYVRHKCNPLWETRSLFYEGPQYKGDE